MEYIYDSNCVSKLIDVTEEMYFRYRDILDVRFRDDKYYYLIGELTRLSKLEDEILLSFPKTSRLLDDVNDCIRKVYKCDNYIMYNFVLNRIDSNICNLCALAENELFDVSLIDSQDNINCIHNELYFNYILRLNNVIDSFNSIDNKRKIRFIQLAHIFSFKKISDAFINNNLCLDRDLIDKREDTYDDIDSYNSFMYLKNNIAFNLCESFLMRNITLSNYYNEKSNDVFYLSNMLLFNSLLKELNDPDFIEIKNLFMVDFENFKSDNFIIGNLKKCFDLEYDRRFSIEKNENIQSLDMNFSSNLITLLKLEETLYDKIMDLKLDGFDNFNIISSLIRFEEELIGELDINADNVSIISSIIYRDLGFFIDVYSNSFKKDAIVQRLKNSFAFFRKSDLADGILEKNYDSIMSNHIVDSLKKYNGSLNIVKSYLYMYPCLTNDLVLLSGNYSMMDRFSDELTSISLGNNCVYDYCYDKSEQLYKVFNLIIDDLIRYSDLYESDWSKLFDFKLCELSDIIDSVSDEHLYEINAEINCLEDGMIKNKILSLIKNRVY
ncbi:MAG: hypothetical protein IKF91_06080 [Bacilli bacterium]|nr:hypothetical protein [Bacilli bacterium]